jgi:hypothetical protein
MCILRPPTGYDQVMIACEDRKVYSYSSANVVDVTPTGWASATDPRAWTGSILGEVAYSACSRGGLKRGKRWPGSAFIGTLSPAHPGDEAPALVPSDTAKLTP